MFGGVSGAISQARILMSSSFKLFGLLALLAQSASALYFLVHENTQRCFIEDLPENTLVRATYFNLDYRQHHPIRITVLDPTGQEVLSHDGVEEDAVVFTSEGPGEYLICIACGNTERADIRFTLDVEYGEHAIDYDSIAKSEHLSAIEVEVRKLNDKLRDIQGEQEYQKKREASFRNVNETMNTRVMWWSILQTIVLVCSALWQIRSLVSFLRAKKAV